MGNDEVPDDTQDGSAPVGPDDDNDEDEAYWSAIENSPEFIDSLARGRADAAAGRGILA